MRAAGCGGGTPDSRWAARPLLPYEGHAAELFDDRIEPGALGFQLGMLSNSDVDGPRTDNLLRERTQVGDAIIRARVTTVTSKGEGRGRSWQIGIATVERLAGGAAADDKDGQFTLSVGPSDPSAGIVRVSEGRLVGATFIAFLRHFAHAEGAVATEASAVGRAPGPELHFHVARDAKDELDAIQAAVLLDRVR